MLVPWMIALVQVNSLILQLYTLIMTLSTHQIQMTTYPQLMSSKVQSRCSHTKWMLSHRVLFTLGECLCFELTFSNISFLSFRSRRLQNLCIWYDTSHIDLSRTNIPSIISLILKFFQASNALHCLIVHVKQENWFLSSKVGIFALIIPISMRS